MFKNNRVKIWLVCMMFTIPALKSCYKEPEPGVGRIIVIDENKIRIPNASVKLSQGAILENLTTDYKGEVEYTNPLEVILNVDVKRGVKVGSGIIRVKPGETNTEVVTIY